LTPEVLSGNGHVFPVPEAHHQVIYSGQFWFGAGEFFAPNPPFGALLTYYLPAVAGVACRSRLQMLRGRRFAHCAVRPWRG